MDRTTRRLEKVLREKSFTPEVLKTEWKVEELISFNLSDTMKCQRWKRPDRDGRLPIIGCQLELSDEGTEYVSYTSGFEHFICFLQVGLANAPTDISDDTTLTRLNSILY